MISAERSAARLGPILLSQHPAGLAPACRHHPPPVKGALQHPQQYSPLPNRPLSLSTMGNIQQHGSSFSSSSASPLKAFEHYRLVSSSRGNLTTTVDKGLAGTKPRTVTYAFASQRGSKGSVNKDCVLLRPTFLGRPELALFGVMDGHGPDGLKLSALARDHLEAVLAQELSALLAEDEGLCGTDDPERVDQIAQALERAFKEAHRRVESHDSTADECFSGACAVLLLFVGQRLFVASAGTARAVLTRRPTKAGQSPQAASLSSPHTLEREDERERIESSGGRALTLSQMDRVQDGREAGEARPGEALRVWDGKQAKPGVVFTRSIGDTYAKRLGVCAAPEVCVHVVDDRQDVAVCLGSDGAFASLSGHDLADMVHSAASPMAVCRAVAHHYLYHGQSEAQQRRSSQGLSDDATLLCIFLQELGPGRCSDKEEEQVSAGRGGEQDTIAVSEYAALVNGAA